MKQILFSILIALLSSANVLGQDNSLDQIINETCNCFLEIQNKSYVYNSTIAEQKENCVASTMVKHINFFKNNNNRDRYFSSFSKLDSIEDILLNKFELEHKNVFDNEITNFVLSDVIYDFENENDARKKYMFKEVQVEGYLVDKYYGSGKYIFEISGESGDNIEGDGVYGRTICYPDNGHVVNNLEQYSIYGDFHLIKVKGDVVELEYVTESQFVGDGIIDVKICNITLDNVIITHINGKPLIDKKKENEVIEPITNQEENIWKKAQKYNTISSYNSYLKLYPNGKFSFDANELINQLTSKEIQKSTRSDVKVKDENNKLLAPIIKSKNETRSQNENTQVTTNKAEKVEEQYEDQNIQVKKQSNNNSIKSNKEEIEDNFVYKIVQEKASFVGGDDKMITFISHNIKYPKKALRRNTQGRVFVRVIVEKNGELSNVQILKGLSDECDQEALRIVRLMPNWITGKNNGKIVRAEAIIPITFKII